MYYTEEKKDVIETETHKEGKFKMKNCQRALLIEMT